MTLFSKHILAVVLGAVTLVGCTTREYYPESSNTLKAMLEQPNTKVAVDDAQGKITWTAGDQIAVHVGAAYVTAEVTPDNGEFSVEETASSYRNFYAVYPASVAVATSYGNTDLKVNLPDEYDITDIVAGTSTTKTSDFSPLPMVAVNDVNSSILYFYHVGGLLRINLSGVKPNTQKVRVTFDKDVTGEYTVADPSSDNPSISTAGNATNNVVTFTLAEDTIGETIAAGTITLNVPVPCGTYESVTVECLDNSIPPEVIAAQTFDDRSLDFERHHGKRLAFGMASINFYLGPIDNIWTPGGSPSTETFTVYSYSSDGYETTGVPWKAYVLAGDGETLLTPDDEGWPSWLSLPSLSGNGAVYGEDKQIQVEMNEGRRHVVKTDPYFYTGIANYNNVPTFVENIQNRPPVGSEDSPRDLSLYDIYGSPYLTGSNAVSSINQAGSHTANCYVVSAPGWYCIPLVYGNAIDATRGTADGASGGKVNAIAYTSSNSTNGAFVNADGQGIGSPYILSDPNLSTSGDYDAVVVWQDVLSGWEIIQSGQCQVIDAPQGAGLSCKYIRFYINPNDIIPGNIVIALRDHGNGEKILWSWHIWVTDVPANDDMDMFKIRDLYYRPSNGAAATELVKILNCDIGWLPQLYYYDRMAAPERQATIVIVPDYGDAEPVSFTVKQEGYPPFNEQNLSARSFASAPYFQWGRKDPFLPLSSGDNKNYSNAESQYEIVDPAYSDGLNNQANDDISFWIKNPYIFNSSTTTSAPRTDLWNETYKTIYDPSPAGFCVPHRRVFTGSTTDGTNQGFQSTELCGINRNSWSVSYNGMQDQSTYTIFIFRNEARTPRHTLNDNGLWTAAHKICAWYYSAGIEPQRSDSSVNIHRAYAIKPILEQ